MSLVDPPALTQDEAKALLNYEPRTGVWTFRDKSGCNQRRFWSDSIARERDGRMVVEVKGKVWSAARLAFLYMAGYIPKHVKHLNGNPRDIRWENLAGYDEAPKPATTGRIVDLEAYTPRRVNCWHCKNTWIAQFDLSVSWLKCAHCQSVLRGPDLREQVRGIKALKDLPRQ